jgi:hypothetical protein
MVCSTAYIHMRRRAVKIILAFLIAPIKASGLARGRCGDRSSGIRSASSLPALSRGASASEMVTVTVPCVRGSESIDNEVIDIEPVRVAMSQGGCKSDAKWFYLQFTVVEAGGTLVDCHHAETSL